MKLSLTTCRLLTDRSIRAGIIAALLLAGCARGGVYHRVESGQTLYRISRVYELDEIYLARVNGISDPTQLQVGTRLYIPGADSVRHIASAAKTEPAKSPAAAVPAARRTPPAQTKPPVKPAAVRKQAAQPVVAQPQKVPEASQVKLLWPLKGAILRSFSAGAKGGGKGLEIAAREQSEVIAAAAGKVIYSGDGVKGYGHLIILQHENDFYTVYGFNSRNLVGQGDFVSRGEKIAFSGAPPGGGEPRLHFEVRRKKLAVDPILYLP
ncbi:MAG TPA: M23 family metallopeptidase [Geopsychrobacteraceae bacterium]